MIIDPDGIKEVCYVKEFISKRNNVSLYELTDKEKKSNMLSSRNLKMKMHIKMN